MKIVVIGSESKAIELAMEINSKRGCLITSTESDLEESLDGKKTLTLIEGKFDNYEPTKKEVQDLPQKQKHRKKRSYF